MYLLIHINNAYDKTPQRTYPPKNFIAKLLAVSVALGTYVIDHDAESIADSTSN